MPSRQRRSLLPRRRRHDDEAEEDGSTVGDVQEYASSEGSLTSGREDNAEVSGDSADEGLAQSMPLPAKQPVSQVAGHGSKTDQLFRTTADTEAMLNGLKMQEKTDMEELHFDDATSQDLPRSKSQPIDSTKHKIASQPFPPNRKGYFLHDDRAGDQAKASQSNYRGRGRGFGNLGNRGAFGPLESDTSKQWTHDLHETVNKPEPAQPAVQPAALAAKPTTGPNRSFSTTTILGNVTIQMSLPGTEKKTYSNVVKKHYTLLPQHRPPLRRDKPVRISIPDEHPRYIFPSSDRSFIFIPRALRPNQQGYRGRGRGSFHGSRRTSMYAGSAYTPSIAMSRKSSIVASGPGSGVHTPTGAPMPPMQLGMMQRPIVRMPGPAVVPAILNTEVFMGDNAAIIHIPPHDLNLQHPRPQKAILVGDIESPTFRAPQQQTQQPFHQQMPPAVTLAESQQKMPHIPEGAVYAQPFQPYPAMQHPGYYGMHYSGHMMMPATDNMGYPMGMGGPVVGSQQISAPEHHQRQGAVAHESNGMVYYYDPSQQAIPQYQPTMMNMMQTGPYFYPPVQNQMFYQ